MVSLGVMLDDRGCCSRRSSLKLLALSAAAIGLEEAACQPAKPLDCSDSPGLVLADRSLRQSLGYVEQSPLAEQRCSGCAQYIGGTLSCGTCKLLKGPIHPAGYCKVWAAKG